MYSIYNMLNHQFALVANTFTKQLFLTILVQYIKMPVGSCIMMGMGNPQVYSAVPVPVPA
jgi:hypothetical protein